MVMLHINSVYCVLNIIRIGELCRNDSHMKKVVIFETRCRCGLLLLTGVAWCVCVCVCSSQNDALQKRLDRSRCRLACEVGLA